MLGSFNPVPKPTKGRKSKKTKDFPPEVRTAIRERQKGMCAHCGRPIQQIHHIIYRSQGGQGTPDNGVGVCIPCHQWGHTEEGRRWFETYRENFLLKVSCDEGNEGLASKAQHEGGEE